LPPHEINVNVKAKSARTERAKRQRRNTSPPEAGWDEVEGTLYDASSDFLFRQKPESGS
jgi:hypothetical protein